MMIDMDDHHYINAMDMIILGQRVINQFRAKNIRKYETTLEYFMDLKTEFGEEPETGYHNCLDEENCINQGNDIINGYQNQYNDMVFWNELTSRLAARDAILKYRERSIDMTVEEKLNMISDVMRKYEVEFGQNGLKNLGFINRV